jgi:maltose alpha-D-glucosyltransferase/alpha-amylase
MPGVPFIYYGDEIGMHHLHSLTSKEGGYFRTGARTPMQWDHSLNAGFSKASPERIYLPIDPDPDFPDVNSQEKDQNSLLYAVKRLISLRMSSKAFTSSGDFKVLFALKNKYPFIYQRSADDDVYITAINPSNRQVDAEVDLSHLNCQVVLSNRIIPMDPDQTSKGSTILHLPPETFVVFHVN